MPIRARIIIVSLLSAWGAIGIVSLASWFQIGLIQQILLAGLFAWLIATLLARGPVFFLARLVRRLNRILARDFRAQELIETGDPQLDALAHGIAGAANLLREGLAEADRRIDESQNVLDDLVDAVIVVDEQGRVTRVNPAAGIYFGQLPHTTMLGHTLLECTLNHRLDELVRQCLSTRMAAETVLNIYSPKERSLAVAIIPRLSPSLELFGAVAVLHDITEIRRVDRLQKDFVANASHELRTPITGISVMAQSLLAGALEDKDLTERFVGSISDSANRLSRLVDDLLYLNVQESGKQPEQELVDLSEVAESVTEKLRPQASQRDIQLSCSTSESFFVRGDSQDLWRAVMNLVDNAIRYTDPKGSIEVITEPWLAGVRLSVRDTGIGIPADQLDKVFERFYRVDVARSRETGGTGFGLSIVSNIVERHGGRVEVESRVGEGSTFSVILPVQDTQEDTEDSTQTASR